MYKFLLRPKWMAFHLLIVVMVVVMINLALWQVNRLSQRNDFNDQVRINQRADTRPLDDVLTTDADPKTIEWLPVTATGTYLADEELTLVNISQFGTAGVDAISVLVLDDGTRILVNRGFIPLADEVPAPPAEEQTVVGYLRQSAKHRSGSIDNNAEGELTEIIRIDIPRIDDQVEGDLASMYIQSMTETNSAPYPVAAPTLTGGSHLSYAIQWSIFSICAIAGWVLVVRKALAKKRTA